jgi:hypothetical protein
VLVGLQSVHAVLVPGRANNRLDFAADQPRTARSILHYVYYWYNFMPLARGSAAVGYTTILCLFWALGMPISANIPKDYQTDWEAILCRVRLHCPHAQ